MHYGMCWSHNIREFARRIRIMMLRLGSILHARVCYFISNFSESHLLEMSLVTWILFLEEMRSKRTLFQISFNSVILPQKS